MTNSSALFSHKPFMVASQLTDCNGFSGCNCRICAVIYVRKNAVRMSWKTGESRTMTRDPRRPRSLGRCAVGHSEPRAASTLAEGRVSLPWAILSGPLRGDDVEKQHARAMPRLGYVVTSNQFAPKGPSHDSPARRNNTSRAISPRRGRHMIAQGKPRRAPRAPAPPWVTDPHDDTP